MRTGASGGSFLAKMKKVASTPVRLTVWLTDLSDRGFTLDAGSVSTYRRKATLAR